MFKKTLITLLKFGISFAILAYLFIKTSQDKDFESLVKQPKNWSLMVVACALAMSAILITFIRWYLLVLSLNLPFSLKDAFRLGFIGYLFNFMTLGVVGGDAVKALFVARQIPQRKPEVVATVLIDRVIGLFALFFVASMAFMFVDFSTIKANDQGGIDAVRRTAQVAFGLTMSGLLFFCLLLLPKSLIGSLLERLAGIPVIGKTIAKLINAIRAFRYKLRLLLVAMLMSLCVHSLNTASVYVIACGLPGDQPTLGTHFVIVPISMLAGAIPLPGGLGAFEYALDFLYRCVSTVTMTKSQGFVIALGYRVITILIAVIGVVYYLTSRREMSQLLEEAKQPDEKAKNKSIEANAVQEAVAATAEKKLPSR